jgi:signal transduction histidine kinase
MLPGMDGLEVCRELKASPATREIMVVMVTGRGSVSHRIEGFDAGADDFIPKPFHHPELLARVRSALRIKRLNDELSDRNRQLVESRNELVRQEKMATIGLLASGIAHEFNNIMAGISGYAQLARKNPKYLPQLVEIALTQTERAEELTNSLSSYHRQSSYETGCSVEDVIRRAFCLVKKMIESNGVSLTLTNEDVPPASISPGQLQEIVLNMLLNSIHAIGPTGGEIAVEIGQSEPPGAVAIRIRDSGDGIAEENLNKIFDPFFTTKGALGGGSGQGTGLGLSMCYNIVQSRGGKIEVESELGKGTQFTVTIPRFDGRLANPDEFPPVFPCEEPSVEARERRILVVDDEGPIRCMLSEFLSDHDVRCCESGDEALAAYREEPYDFVVLDICMENSPSGIETFRALREIDAEVRVILASGRLPEEISEDTLEEVHGHLLKPFKLDALAALLGIEASETAGAVP